MMLAKISFRVTFHMLAMISYYLTFISYNLSPCQAPVGRSEKLPNKGLRLLPSKPYDSSNIFCNMKMS